MNRGQEEPFCRSGRKATCSQSARRFSLWSLLGFLAAFTLFLPALRGFSAQSGDCLPNIKLIDDHGRPFSPASLRGKVVLVSFVHTECAEVCDVIVDKFAEVARKLGPELGSKVVLLSVSNDPETDRPPVLLKMAREHRADMPGWVFATGSKKAVAQFMRCYGLELRRQADGEPEHVVKVFLVAPDGREAQSYWGVVDSAQKIVDGINRLLAGENAKLDQRKQASSR